MTFLFTWPKQHLSWMRCLMTMWIIDELRLNMGFSLDPKFLHGKIFHTKEAIFILSKLAGKLIILRIKWFEFISIFSHIPNVWLWMLNLSFSFLIYKRRALHYMQAVYHMSSWLNAFYEKCFTHPFPLPHFSIIIWYVSTNMGSLCSCYWCQLLW